MTTTSEQNDTQMSDVPGNFEPTKFLEEQQIRKNLFLFKNICLKSFLMIPLTTLYYEYIDRPKMTEQKNPFEYRIQPH